MQNDPLNTALLGQAGGALRLQTPALVLDLDIFKCNVQSMAKHCKQAGISLRPHSKTHKCLEIARQQIAAGAVGICCAKLGEAEVMINGGIESVLITSPVVTEGAIKRLCKLNLQAPELIVVMDNPVNSALISQHAAQSGKEIKILVDLDPNLHRTGIAPGQAAIALVKSIVQDVNLSFMGLQTYAGQVMHMAQFMERKDASMVVMQMLSDMRKRLSEEGIECKILSGGGTGTFDIDAHAKVLTELQAGSYIVMDRQYNEVYAEPSPGDNEQLGSLGFASAMFVQMSVVSNNTPGLVTVDAGFKCFATDADTPQLCWSADEDAVSLTGAKYFFFGDEHGGVKLKQNASLDLGTVLRAIVPHCDPTINLYDYIHVIQGDKLVDIWPVDARGKSA